MRAARLPPQPLTHVLFGLLLVAIVTNGLYFWLQKSQLVPSKTYIEYRQEVTTFRAKEAQGIFVPQPQLELKGFYAVPGPWLITKLLKDLFCVTFLLVSFLQWQRTFPETSPVLIVALLLGLVIVAAGLHALRSHGGWVAGLGLRPFAYLLAGVLAAWAVSRPSLALLCRYLVAVLLIELAFALYEYFYGLPLFSTASLRARVNGTFSFPASLGIFAVTTLSFAFAFSNLNKLFLLTPVALVVYLTGSGTAVVLLAAFLGVWTVISVPANWQPVIRAASLAAIVTMLFMLPKMMDRRDVLDSLWGRVEVVVDYVNNLPNASSVLFGKGLGIGSNVLNSAINQLDAINEPEGVDTFHARADSTPMALIHQIGVVGTLLFYLLLACGAWRDRPAVAIYVVMFLASLTVNLLELFPVNFLLGLLLCRSLMTPLCSSEKSARIERQIKTGTVKVPTYRDVTHV